MEENIIKRIRICKIKLLKLYKNTKSNIDFEVEMIDSQSLYILQTISKIDEELTDIIYILLNNKNS